MRQLRDWMKVYGFKDGANDEVAEAFIRNVAKSAYGVAPSLRKKRGAKRGEQLAFDFEAAGFWTAGKQDK